MNGAAENILIELVDWAAMENGYPYYRPCDICFLTATEDCYAGKSIDEFRQFFRVSVGKYSSLDVCEHCLDAYLAELRE